MYYLKHSARNLTSYLILFIGLSFGFFMFFLFRYDFEAKIIISAAVSAFYALWGIIHHALEKRLHYTIALEYILFAIFSFLLLLTALNL